LVKKELLVENELGFHARVACRIARSAAAFASSVLLQKDGKDYDLKTVTGVMMANAKRGDYVDVVISGSDEEQAAAKLEQLFAEKFGER
jgi:phosphocarrier protein